MDFNELMTAETGYEEDKKHVCGCGVDHEEACDCAEGECKCEQAKEEIV